MDTNNQVDLISSSDLEVDATAQAHMEQLAKWARFISISMFVICAIGFLVFLIGGLSELQNLDNMRSSFGIEKDMEGAFVIIVLIIAATIFVFWFSYLYRFSRQIREAVFAQDSDLLAAAFRSLRNHFIISVIMSSLSFLSGLFNLVTNEI